MTKRYRIRIRGKQRDDIDIDLLAQALLMIAEDLQGNQGEEKSKRDETEPQERP
jgi:hypothetical protein